MSRLGMRIRVEGFTPGVMERLLVAHDAGCAGGSRLYGLGGLREDLWGNGGVPLAAVTWR